MEKQKAKTPFLKIMILTLTISSLGVTTANAAQNNGYGQGQGRTDSVNINDYSTSSSDRFSQNYKFESGTNANKDMGRPTHTNVVPKPNPLTTNVQRNKDASFAPPSYGMFSGSFDTERTNPYFSPANYDNVRNTTDYTQSATGNVLNGSNADGMLPSTSLINGNNNASGSNNTINQSTTGIPQLPNNNQNTTTTYKPQPKATQTARQNDLKTQAWLYDDGSLGTLSIPRFNAKVKVYEGESLTNLKKGLGHFAFSSVWDGNVAICGVRPDRALLKVA